MYPSTKSITKSAGAAAVEAEVSSSDMATWSSW
jgi:hypothetical protein